MLLKHKEIPRPQTKPGQETEIHVNISKSDYSLFFFFDINKQNMEASDQVVWMEIQAAGEMVEENHSKRLARGAIRT